MNIATDSRLPTYEVDYADALGWWAATTGGTFENVGHAKWLIRDGGGVPCFYCIALAEEMRDLGLAEVS